MTAVDVMFIGGPLDGDKKIIRPNGDLFYPPQVAHAPTPYKWTWVTDQDGKRTYFLVHGDKDPMDELAKHYRKLDMRCL